MGEKTLKKRVEIPAKDKWKLEDMFASEAQWEEECGKVRKLSDELTAFAGKLSESADALLSYWKKHDEMLYYMSRVYCYANQRYDEDTAVSKNQANLTKAESVWVAASSAESFAAPEILAIAEETLDAFYCEKPGLAQYKRAMDEIRRSKDHILSAAEERIMAEAGEVSTAPANIFSMFNNADIKFPSLTDVEGNRIQITHGNFISLMNDKDRSLRKQAFRGVYDTYAKFGNTVAAMFLGNLKQESFQARMRGYSSVRAMHLDNGNIPESVYDNLIETVHKHLPALHRYMSIRKKILGVEHLHMYDLYVQIGRASCRERV